MLREIAPNAAILHAAYQWDEYGPRIPVLNPVPPLEHLLGTPWAPPLPGFEHAGAALVDEADAVVCQGGGFLVEAYSPRARLAALADTVRRGKPLALLGIALGHFEEPAARRDLTTVLERAGVVVVRDRQSLQHAEDAGARAAPARRRPRARGVRSPAVTHGGAHRRLRRPDRPRRATGPAKRPGRRRSRPPRDGPRARARRARPPVVDRPGQCGCRT